jgi:penicillin-binding protein 2
MKFLRWLNIIFFLIFLSACSSSEGGGIAVPFLSTDTPLPPPPVTIQSAPSADAALTAYLDAFKADDYNTMYSMLSKVSRDSITLEDFALRNRDSLNTMSAGSFDYQVLSSLINPYSSDVSFHVTYHTALVGEIDRDMVAKFTLEDGVWKLNWDAECIAHGLQHPLARQHL